MSASVRFFDTLSSNDVALVGGKNAALGEMYRELAPKGIRVPNGFATTSDAFREFLRVNGIDERIRDLLDGLDVRDIDELSRRARAVRDLVLHAELPEDLSTEILEAYRTLSRESGEQATDVAVRSSATAEDLPEASFAGQQESYLNIRGEAALLLACRKCFASLFTDRAIAYRVEQGFDHSSVALSVGVQKMVRSDIGASGVMFTLDTETGFRDVVLINAAYGLGESIVRGVTNPDEIYVFKPTLRQGYRPILQKRVGDKETKLVYETRGGVITTKTVPVPASDRRKLCVTDEELLTLSEWAMQLEEHFSAKSGEERPLDIEWARDGRTGELFILQARPETVQARREAGTLRFFHLREEGKTLVTGRAVGDRIGIGPVRLVRTRQEMAAFRQGDVLVTEMTDPDWVPLMRKAAAIVTERGGRTCHAAIVSRELGIPAVVGAPHALEVLTDGQKVTVSCAGGEVGSVFEGELEYDVNVLSSSDVPEVRTPVMMNIADPDRAFELAALPAEGVGLARMEFIINGAIQIHPMALVRYPELRDEEALARIETLTAGYERKPDYFVDHLSQGIAKITAAFYPKDVILRMSDFKTNEYAGLVGGAEFEPDEENPMLGFRGASRYYHPDYEEAFALECAAVRRVRQEMGLTNLKVMIPFCRTVEEGEKVLEVLKRNELVQGEDGLEIYVMCEIPSNVILARDFARVFDGFSIGSNDLTQMVLGVDRDSEIVAPLFDERNDAVMDMIRDVIGTVQEEGKKIGICGQAPSDYPEFARFLVECGIDTISLTPDRIIPTLLNLAEVEEKVEAATV